jgi:hypothetical protein
MKEFIFDEYEHCINPNRLELGNKNFYLEIQTSCKDGKWLSGHKYWTRGHKDDWPCSLNTNVYDSEHTAIHNETKFLIKSLKEINERFQEYSRDFEVPEFIFSELKELEIKSKNPQLKLF